MARPIKLKPEVQNKIIVAIKAGNYIETAAAYAGISKNTLYDWLKRGEREKQRVNKNSKAKIRKLEADFVEFSDAIEKALAEAEIRDVTIIAKAAEEQWQAAAWRLERKFPDRWGRRKLDIEHSGEIGIKIVDDINDEG
jgi:transposase